MIHQNSSRNVFLPSKINEVQVNSRISPWLSVRMVARYFPFRSKELISFTDGKSLTFALEKELSKTFLELAIMCKAVICCLFFLLLLIYC